MVNVFSEILHCKLLWASWLGRHSVMALIAPKPETCQLEYIPNKKVENTKFCNIMNMSENSGDFKYNTLIESMPLLPKT